MAEVIVSQGTRSRAVSLGPRSRDDAVRVRSTGCACIRRGPDDSAPPMASSIRSRIGRLVRRNARSEDKLRLVLIVAAAPERQVLGRGRTAERIRLDVMELQERAFSATVTVWSDERALAAVVLPHHALVVSGDFT